ncbi:MAG TPA: hypothetical protein VNQ99_15820 [Xanthobacteraceae bacterium]|nr:hypothetical protein [Xanthobacteraceae bacterium]
MKRTMILATALSLAGSLGANGEPLRAMRAPAGAMPAFEAVTITRSMGLDPLSGPVWQNGSYVLCATDEDGRELRVVLDGHDGRVLAVRPLARRYFAPVTVDDGSPDARGFDVVRGRAFDVGPAPAPGRAYPGWRSGADLNSRHVAPSPGDQRRVTTPQRSVRLSTEVAPPLPVKKPSPASRQEAQAAQAASVPAASSESAPRPIRKIEIHRAPEQPAANGVTREAPAAEDSKSTFGFPINPLL